jgi:hypothetical protein
LNNRPFFLCYDCRDSTIKYKTVLGADRLPKTVDKFRDLKYNDLSGFNRIKREYDNEVKAIAFKKRISAGDIDLNVRQQKQQDHVLGSMEWKRRVTQSVKAGEPLENAFYKDVDVQKLIEKSAGKGIMEFSGKQPYPKEYVNTDIIVGTAYDREQMKYLKSKRIAIHYSSSGTHAYPVPPFRQR